MKLPPTLSATGAGGVWGCSEWTVRQHVGDGTLPVEPLRLGRLLRWSTVAVYLSVGIDVADKIASFGASEDEVVPI